MTPAERRLRASAAAHAMHARNDSRATTKAGRRAFLDRFVDEVDPDRVLPERERLRRAEHAKSAHFKKLALRSAQARRKAAGR